ncbi:MAG TPA: signal recognition particle protein, partial [Polyangiaceae bacterium]
MACRCEAAGREAAVQQFSKELRTQDTSKDREPFGLGHGHGHGYGRWVGPPGMVLPRADVFETLTRGFREAQNRLAGLAELNPKNVQAALREVRLSLLEADVELGVVKRFLSSVESKADGRIVQTRVRHGGETHRVSAGDQFVKICHDQLVEMMSAEGEPIHYAESGRTGVMMVGLQGSGKTTTAAKLARWFEKQGRRPLLVAADMQRPAAVEQLEVLGKQIGVPVFNLPGETPLNICILADENAKKHGRDVIVYDTAGRLAIDEPLMQELGDIKHQVRPHNIYLVVDAMVGQDAVQTARRFHEQLDLTGVILTKLDGDARGGAALSVKEVTGAPIVFVGLGETVDKLERFRPEGMASRVLGMGDVVGLIQDFEEVVDEKQAEQDAMRMLGGEFTLDDFLRQVKTIQQMGSLKDLMDKIPGMGGLMGGLPPGAVDLDDRELLRIESMIQSMTRIERKDPHSLIREPSRVQRIARGSGRTEAAVGELVQKFLFMKQMMSGFGQNLGLLGNVPGLRNLASARQMRRAMKSGKLADSMAGLGHMGMPGLG